MPKGAAISEGSSGDNISHFAAIRIRVVGTGNLKMSVGCLGVRSKTLVPFVLQTTNRMLMTRIVNFMETRAFFQIQTTEMDEYFRINRIVVFMKEKFTSYPGN
jgi:hypothetical protein